MVFADDGFLPTNAHVVGSAKTGTAAFADGTESDFDVIGADPLSDLAVAGSRTRAERAAGRARCGRSSRARPVRPGGSPTRRRCSSSAATDGPATNRRSSAPRTRLRVRPIRSARGGSAEPNGATSLDAYGKTEMP